MQKQTIEYFCDICAVPVKMCSNSFASFKPLMSKDLRFEVSLSVKFDDDRIKPKLADLCSKCSVELMNKFIGIMKQ